MPYNGKGKYGRRSPFRASWIGRNRHRELKKGSFLRTLIVALTVASVTLWFCAKPMTLADRKTTANDAEEARTRFGAIDAEKRAAYARMAMMLIARAPKAIELSGAETREAAFLRIGSMMTPSNSIEEENYRPQSTGEAFQSNRHDEPENHKSQDSDSSTSKDQGPDKQLAVENKTAVPKVELKKEVIDILCESLLGKGRSEKIYHLCTPWKDDRGSKPEAKSMLECDFNPVLRSSFCHAQNLIIDPNKIQVSRGGEPIAQVQGRDEQAEFPTYQDGAFQLSQCSLNFTSITRDQLPHHLVNMMESFEETNSDDAEKERLFDRMFGRPDHLVCDSFEEDITLIVTRYEYANLYHTYTDWYSAYQSAVWASDGDPAALDHIRIIFFDGHSQGAMDSGWEVLFPHANITYISQYQNILQSPNRRKMSPLCLRHAVFVPPGYRAPLSISVMDDFRVSPVPGTYAHYCAGGKWQGNFRDTMVKNSIRRLTDANGWLFQNLEANLDPHQEEEGDPNLWHQHHPHLHLKTHHHGRSNQDPVPTVRVLFILRRNYLSHPRMNGSVTRRIQNEEELLTRIRSYGPPKKEEASVGLQHRFMNRQRALHHDDHSDGYEFGDTKAFVDLKQLILEAHDVDEQIVMIQQADVVIGMHGAGMSHIVVSRPGTVLLELSAYPFSHFHHLCNLAGCLYKSYALSLPNPETEPYLVPVEGFDAAFKDAVASYLIHQQEIARKHTTATTQQLNVKSADEAEKSLFDVKNTN